MSETDSIPCFAPQSSDGTSEYSPATQGSQNMFFSKQNNTMSQQIPQSKKTIPQTDKIKQLYLFPPSSQMLSSVSTSSSSSSVASGSSKAQPGGVIPSNSSRNVQPPTKKYKVKINSGKGTIPVDFFSQFYDSVLSKRAMTAVAKERKSKEGDEMRPMSQMVEYRNHEERIQGIHTIEKRINTNIKSNKSQISSKNNNFTDLKRNQHSQDQTMQNELTEMDILQSQPYAVKHSLNQMSLNEENLMTFSTFPIFQIQDTPKFSSGPETQDTEFFPFSNKIDPNQPLEPQASKDNSLKLQGKTISQQYQQNSSINLNNKNKLTPASIGGGITCSGLNTQPQRVPPPSEDQSEIHMSFSDCLVLENTNNNNKDCVIDGRIISQEQNDKQANIITTISGNEETSDNDQESQKILQQNLLQPEEMLSQDFQPIPQLKLRRCASMETEIQFQKQELLAVTKRNESTLLHYGHGKSNPVYQNQLDVAKDTERESFQDISQKINIEGNKSQQQQQQHQQHQAGVKPSSSDKNQSKSKGITLKNSSSISSSRFINKHCSAHQIAGNDNFNHSVEFQALKEVYRQQRLVKQPNLIAKFVSQDYSQQQGQEQSGLHKQLNKQESVPNLQINSTEEDPQLVQLKPKQYYLGMNQQRSSSTGEISGGSISYFMKSRSKIPEHKKSGSQVDGISIGDALTKVSFTQKPVRVIASGNSKRIRDLQGQSSPTNKFAMPQQRKSQEILSLTSQEQMFTQKALNDTDSKANLINKVKKEQNLENTDNQPQQQQFFQFQQQEQKGQESKQKTNFDPKGKKSKWLNENTASFYNLGGSIVSPEKGAFTERLGSLDQQNYSCGILKNKQQNTTIQSGVSMNALNNSEDIMHGGNNYFHMRSGSKNQAALANYCQQFTNQKNEFPQILTNRQATKNKSNYLNSNAEGDRQSQISMIQQQTQNSLCLQKSQLNNKDNSKYFNMKKHESQELLLSKMSSSQSKLRLQSPERTSSREHNRKIISTLASSKPLQGVLSKLVFPERERATGTHLAGCLTVRTPINRQTYLNMK